MLTKQNLIEIEKFLAGFEDDDEQKNVRAMLTNVRAAIIAPPPRVAIICDGGLVQEVIADIPMRAIVCDYDVEGADEEDLTKIPQNEGEDDQPASISQPACDDSPETIDDLLKNYPHPV